MPARGRRQFDTKSPRGRARVGRVHRRDVWRLVTDTIFADAVLKVPSYGTRFVLGARPAGSTWTARSKSLGAAAVRSSRFW